MDDNSMSFRELRRWAKQHLDFQIPTVSHDRLQGRGGQLGAVLDVGYTGQGRSRRYTLRQRRRLAAWVKLSRLLGGAPGLDPVLLEAFLETASLHSTGFVIMAGRSPYQSVWWSERPYPPFRIDLDQVVVQVPCGTGEEGVE